MQRRWALPFFWRARLFSVAPYLAPLVPQGLGGRIRCSVRTGGDLPTTHVNADELGAGACFRSFAFHGHAGKPAAGFPFNRYRKDAASETQVLTCEDCADARQYDGLVFELDGVRSFVGAEGNSLLPAMELWDIVFAVGVFRGFDRLFEGNDGILGSVLRQLV